MLHKKKYWTQVQLQSFIEYTIRTISPISLWIDSMKYIVCSAFQTWLMAGWTQHRSKTNGTLGSGCSVRPTKLWIWHQDSFRVNKLSRFESIWVFPKIGVLPNHPILIGFSIINHPFGGTPIFGNTHMFLAIWIDFPNMFSYIGWFPDPWQDLTPEFSLAATLWAMYFRTWGSSTMIIKRYEKKPLNLALVYDLKKSRDVTMQIKIIWMYSFLTEVYFNISLMILYDVWWYLCTSKLELWYSPKHQFL